MLLTWVSEVVRWAEHCPTVSPLHSQHLQLENINIGQIFSKDFLLFCEKIFDWWLIIFYPLERKVRLAWPCDQSWGRARYNPLALSLTFLIFFSNWTNANEIKSTLQRQSMRTEIEIHDINIWIIFVYILLCFVKGFRF